ncbi:MAG: metallophosphoesterase [Chitinophagales bacterium]|nr:metallophosphoesterase [Chitinophagales bacterium]
MKNIFLLLSICCLFFSNAQVSVTVGPYLQSPTSTSMKIMWRTDSATASKVMVGTALNSLGILAEDTAVVTNHMVNVTGLQPYTKYFYAVYDGGTLLSGNDSEHWFRTFPTAGSDVSTRVWAIGDFGKGNSEQRRVRDAYINYDTVGTDFFIWLGDNAYADGTEAEYLNKVFDSINGYAKPMKHWPFLPSPGNHDYNSISPVTAPKPPLQHAGPYYDLIEVYRNAEAGGVSSGHELYYSFDYGNAHFISLNSELGSLFTAADDWNGVSPLFSFNTSPQKQWLIQDLQANTKPWVIAYFHQPPYTDGSHDAGTWWEVYMKAMRKNYVPILEQYGVDLVVCGHSHVYERSYLAKGAYGDVGDITLFNILQNTSGNDAIGEAYLKYKQGTNPNQGTVYVVCGNSASKDDNPPFNHPYMYSEYGCDTCCGSFVIDITGNKLVGRHIDMTGVTRDEFTMYKIDGAASTDEFGPNSPFVSLSVTPNPFSQNINVDFELKKQGEVTIELSDISGKLYQVFRAKLNTGSNTVSVDASKYNLAKGSYMVTLRSGEMKLSRTIIKTE